MKSEPAIDLRKTGISVAGDVPWGTHYCHFYETKQDLLDTLVPFFKAGLENREFCLWIVSDTDLITVEEAKGALTQAVPDLERHLADENIEILNGLEWYLEENVFNLERVTGAWDAKLNRALARGYDGMRVSGDTFWLAEKDWKDFFAYEKQLNESITDHPMTVLCTYPLAKSGAAEVLDVVQAHQFAIARRQGEWKVIETPELIQAKAEIRRLNEELEQRVVERTGQLARAIEELTDEISVRKQSEVELSLAHQRLSYHVENTPLAVIEWDKDLFIKRWSKRAEEIFGWTASEALEINMYDRNFPVVHEDDVQAVAEISGQLIKGTVNSKLGINRNYTKDGNVIYCEWYNSVLRDEDGNVITILSLVHDVTERKRAEALLYAKEQEFRTIVENAPDQIIRYDREFRRVYANPAVAKAYGLPAKALNGKTIGSVIQDARLIIEDDELALLRQRIAAVFDTGNSYEFEMNWPLPAGRTYFSVRLFPELDLNGSVVNVLGISRDITESKRAQDALRRSEDHLRLVIDTIPTMAWTVRPDGVVDFLNQRWMDYTGLSLEQFVAEPTGPIHPEDIPGVTERWLVEMAVGEPYEEEMRLRRADGVYRWFLVRTVPLRDEQGNLVKWYGVSSDIQDLKRAEDSLREALLEINQLKDQLYKENIALREEIVSASMFEEIIGSSPALQEVLVLVAKVAPTNSTVLITGETGTGKELIARAIHKRSNRTEHVFMSLNCAAIPPALIASELFGHEKGAFTGAVQLRLGRFELAEGGTLFLDEIGELPPETQIALLRVLQEHEFERVGGTKPIRADVRVIAATNRDLHAAIDARTFRRDLFYRLNVFPIEMPSLRDRREDIPLLVEYFIHRYASKMGKKILRIDKKTLDRLASSDWPGNIRELQNVIERSVILNETETFTIDKSWLSHKPHQTTRETALLDNLASHEKQIIEAALAESRGKVSGPSGAAAKLGIPPSTLDSKIRALKINKHRFKTT